MSTRLTVSAGTKLGRTRNHNEDAFLIADLITGTPAFLDGTARFEVGPRGALLAVSDGMGGHKAGEVASAMTLAQLQSSLVTRTSTPDPDARLVRASERANEAVYEAGQQPSLRKMGATMTAVLVEGDTAHVAQVGDSRAYLLRNGRIERLTHDQSLAEAAVNAGVLGREDVRASPLHNVLLQAMGQKPKVNVAMSTCALCERDCLVLCSDGLTNELSDDELRETILGAPSLARACDALIARTTQRGHADDATVVLCGIKV